MNVIPNGDDRNIKYDAPSFDMLTLQKSGLLWLINSTVFWPRGYSLALHQPLDRDEITGWMLHYHGEPVLPSSEGVAIERFHRAERYFEFARLQAALEVDDE